MNTELLVSVVMPVYNAEMYMEAALADILGQTYSNIEVICIDDASTDNSWEILEKYASLDKRLQIYQNVRNSGAAYSRNKGIEISKGSYIYFLDADDRYADNMIEILMDTAIEKQADIVWMTGKSFENDSDIEFGSKALNYYYREIFSDYTNIESMPVDYFNQIPAGTTWKFYKKELIVSSDIKFQDLNSSNDVAFGYLALFYAKKIVHEKSYTNLYFVREHGGVNRISNNRNPHDNFLAYKRIKEVLCDNGNWERYAVRVQKRFIINILTEIANCNEAIGKEFYSFLINEGLEEMQIYHNKENICESSDIMRYIINEFANKEYEDLWFKNIPFLKMRLLNCKDNLVDFLAKIGKRYVLWGTGKNGEILAQFIKENDICGCIGIIDNNQKKWGCSMEDLQIYAPCEVINQVDLIIVSSQLYFNEIYEQIKTLNKNVSIISLLTYLDENEKVEKLMIR